MMAFKCRICNESQTEQFVAKEMMFGTHETFNYRECKNCQTLQIEEIPNNLSKYYPDNYYSFNKSVSTKESGAKKWFKALFAKRYLAGKQDVFTKKLKRKLGLKLLGIIKRCDLNQESNILDVGCGNGYRIVNLSKYGFKNLEGIDPYINEDINYDNGVRVFKRELSKHSGQYDMIMLNHVYEHLTNPLETLKILKKLIKPNGTILIAIPVSDSYAWEKYGVNWVALDAPRHLHVFSDKSMKLIASNAGFKVIDKVFDSSEFQFWASEQYLKNISLIDKSSYHLNKEESIFTKEDIERFKIESNKLNKESRGDQAVFFLKNNE